VGLRRRLSGPGVGASKLGDECRFAGVDQLNERDDARVIDPSEHGGFVSQTSLCGVVAMRVGIDQRLDRYESVVASGY
jgi:hypothetical protein